MRTEKVTEQRLRKLAHENGYAIIKSRTRKHFHFNDEGRYQLLDLENDNAIVLGKRFEASLGDIKRFFKTDSRKK